MGLNSFSVWMRYLHRYSNSCVRYVHRRASAEELFRKLTEGDRAALAQSITLIESTHSNKKMEAQKLLRKVLLKNRSTRLENATSSFRIGLSGPPGAGKSTFIETFGKFLTSENNKVAVLAVDPSSATTGGSLLGDKTRMPELSRDMNAYIRPSPNAGHWGGVTRTTGDTIQLCECAGYNIILVETVGVGQSEYSVANMVDLFLLLIPPGGGDELQAVKRGIVEMADVITITKADGNLLPEVRRITAEYMSALRFMKSRSKIWRPRVMKISARENTGIDELWEVICKFRDLLLKNGELDKRRQAQRASWLWNYVTLQLELTFKEHPNVKPHIRDLETKVINEELTPGQACDELMARFLNKN